MRYPFPLTILILSFVVSSCSKFQHIDELLTLKGVSDSQAAMAKDVEATNKRFDELAAAVKSGDIKEYDTQELISRKFGVPILKEQEIKNEKIFDRWMYRHATEFFGADKVYLYFDDSGTLKEWELREAKPEGLAEGGDHGQIGKETTQ